MEQLIELLKQIQELAGVAIDALEQADPGGKPEGDKPDGPPKGDGPPKEDGPPKGGPPPGDGPPDEEKPPA